MAKWREVMPGAFMCIPDGPIKKQDDDQWYQDLMVAIGLNPDGSKKTDSEECCQ